MTSSKTGLTYRDAGVDIDAGNELVERIRGVVARTTRPEVIGGLGGFGGLFELDLDRYRRPVLVGATDGVGTKLRLALQTGRHDTIGVDLVAMCVNDVIVQGAEPLFFLDYYATGKLKVETAASVIAGIAQGCELAGAALIGGETAELPGMYHGDDYDLAGFCVGVVDRERLLTGEHVTPGDSLVGLASSGPHSNGYSLIRRIVDSDSADLAQSLGDGQTLADALMAPTRIYVRSILALLAETQINALAHITGGGLSENLPRVLPDGCRAQVSRSSWQRPAVFDWIASHGDVSETEMLRTFNCGVGMVLVVPSAAVGSTLKRLAELGEHAWLMGRIEAGETGLDYSA